VLEYFTKMLKSARVYRQRKALQRLGIDLVGVKLYADCGISVQKSDVNATDRLKIGEHTYLQGRYSVGANGVLTIGKHCSFRSGTHLSVKDRITIGDHVFGAPNIFISDNNSHPLSPRLRKEMTESDPGSRLWKTNENVLSQPVTIETGVWLGLGVVVLKGVTIGQWSIIGAGAVVTKSIPPFSIAVGNPARVVSTIENDFE
jgi:acetyltransferase-like isoleucine patch superfamily enzyme